jgi:hypothetical protein
MSNYGPLAAAESEPPRFLELVQNRQWSLLFPLRVLRPVVFVLAVLLAGFLSFKAVSNQITETNVLTESRVSLAGYLQGTAYRPFVYRYLTPALVNLAENQLHVPALLPGAVKARLVTFCPRATAVPLASCDDVVSFAVVSMTFFFLFLMTMYVLAARMFGHPLIGLATLAFAFLSVNAILLLGLSHVYDFGVMLFGSLLLLCLDMRRHALFTALLALAFLNKETMILYAGTFFFVNLGRMPLGRNLLFFAGQIAMFVVIHGAVRMHFAGNAGSGHEYYLPEQIWFFTEHINLPMLLMLVLSLLLIFYGFPTKQETLRRACIIIPPWLFLYLVGGVQRELRVVNEILPLLLLLMMDTFVRLVPGRAAPVAGDAPMRVA